MGRGGRDERGQERNGMKKIDVGVRVPIPHKDCNHCVTNVLIKLKIEEKAIEACFIAS